MLVGRYDTILFPIYPNTHQYQNLRLSNFTVYGRERKRGMGGYPNTHHTEIFAYQILRCMEWGREWEEKAREMGGKGEKATEREGNGKRRQGKG